MCVFARARACVCVRELLVLFGVCLCVCASMSCCCYCCLGLCEKTEDGIRDILKELEGRGDEEGGERESGTKRKR